MKSGNNYMRYDLSIIASLVHPGSKVLGLGCGDGELLHYLKNHKNVSETGIEIVESKVAKCIEKGLSVIQGDINEEIADYPDNSFDYVILSQTLQQVFEPSELINSILRISKVGIVSFPNFCHWKIRQQILTTGNVPVTRQLPYEWYNTPNIRVLSIKDFRKYSKDIGFKILKEIAISPNKDNTDGRVIKILPNIFATYGIFQISKTELK